MHGKHWTLLDGTQALNSGAHRVGLRQCSRQSTPQCGPEFTPGSVDETIREALANEGGGFVHPLGGGVCTARLRHLRAEAVCKPSEPGSVSVTSAAFVRQVVFALNLRCVFAETAN